MDFNSGFSSNNATNSDLQRFSHSIGSNIQKISQNVKSIKQLVNQLGTDQDNQQLRSQLHEVQHYTGGLAKDTNIELRDFQNYNVPPGEDSRTWRMQAERLLKDFSQALNDFQSSQRQAAGKEKEALKEAKAQNDATFFETGGGSALVDLNTRASAQTHVQIEQEELQALQEREHQIRQLEGDIFDVNQIFKDLATMVHEQGETIDSIEANVETAHAGVNQASSELGQAAKYQTKARRKKLCIGIWIVIIVIVLSTIIYFAS